MENEFANENHRIFGLVLAGGKSSRMARPKELIEWHGKAQQLFLAELLNTRCEEVYISCRKEQVLKIDSAHSLLPDLEEGKGPLMAIHSAFVLEPNVAWLVLACDLPYFDQAALDFLVENRNKDKMGTYYQSPIDGKAEPLCAIWESSMAELVSGAITMEKRSPRKLLEQTDIQLIVPKNPKTLLNVNTPEEAESAIQSIKRQNR